MPHFLLHHQHDPAECAAAFAAWTGFDEPAAPRARRLDLPQPAAIRSGGACRPTTPPPRSRCCRAIVARRTVPIEVRDIEIP